jgi:hypothetical protein
MGAMEPETQQELEAALAARRELGPEHEAHLVAGFVDRIDKEIDRRIAARVPTRRQGAITPLVLGSLGLSIPLIAVAGDAAGAFGVFVVCLAIVLVNFFAARR